MHNRTNSTDSQSRANEEFTSSAVESEEIEEHCFGTSARLIRELESNRRGAEEFLQVVNKTAFNSDDLFTQGAASGRRAETDASSSWVRETYGSDVADHFDALKTSDPSLSDPARLHNALLSIPSPYAAVHDAVLKSTFNSDELFERILSSDRLLDQGHEG